MMPEGAYAASLDHMAEESQSLVRVMSCPIASEDSSAHTASKRRAEAMVGQHGVHPGPLGV